MPNLYNTSVYNVYLNNSNIWKCTTGNTSKIKITDKFLSSTEKKPRLDKIKDKTQNFSTKSGKLL